MLGERALYILSLSFTCSELKPLPRELYFFSGTQSRSIIIRCAETVQEVSILLQICPEQAGFWFSQWLDVA